MPTDAPVTRATGFAMVLAPQAVGSGVVATRSPLTTMRSRRAALGVTGDERERGRLGLVDDPQVGRLDDDRLAHCVGVIGVGHVEDDLVSGRELVDVTERVAVRHAVTREHGVAALAR